MSERSLGANKLPLEHAAEPPLVRLCRWLTALDGWATLYEVDPAAEEQPSREPLPARDRAQALYVLKEKALQAIFASKSPAVNLGLLEGPQQKARVWLCDQCREKAKQRGINLREYAEQIGGCAHCQHEGRDPDYFSLYVLMVDYGPLGRWAFHTPAPLGRAYFPPPRSAACPVVGTRPTDNEGRIKRLGLSLPASDQRRYPEPEVVWQVWQLVKEVREGGEI